MNILDALTEPSEPAVNGVTAGEHADPRQVYERAVAQAQAVLHDAARRQAQSIRFKTGPVCLVFLADQHIDSSGTDIERAFREARIVAETPGMWAVTMGDLVDNFIIGKLRQARDETQLTISDGWSLGELYLQTIGQKLLASVAGNHDNWTILLAGIDKFRDLVKAIRPGVIYDRDDARINVQVGAASFPIRLRHLWQGSSIWNHTHGIERAAKFDHDFRIGVGGHIHVSGVARGFNLSGGNGMAVLCGSYKRVDPYARRLGLSKPNNSTAVAVLLDEATNSITGFDNLEMAAWIMKLIYGKATQTKKRRR